jgi:hypothetical protein
MTLVHNAPQATTVLPAPNISNWLLALLVLTVLTVSILCALLVQLVTLFTVFH